MEFSFRKILISVFLIVPLLIVGCSNSDSETAAETANKIGRFIDAPVKGLIYSSSPSGLQGTTNENGEYSYEDGDKVAFFIKDISIGEVEATPETPVTNLPNFITVARVLQSLDGASTNSGLIDISQIVIPAAIKSDLNTILTANENTDPASIPSLDVVLSVENLQSIETASIANSGDEAIDLVESVVTVNQAIEHITNDSEILENFTVEDLNGQAFFSYDSEFGHLSTLYFFADGSGYAFSQSANGGDPEKDAFSWSITDEGKLSIISPTETITVTLHSTDGDRYVTTTIEGSEPDSVYAVTLNKVQLLATSDLGGKILKRLDSDAECSARTWEFSEDGSMATVKSLCGDGNEYHESTISVSDVADLNNVIAISGEDGSGDFTAYLSLINGNFETGSQLSFSLTSELSLDDVDATTQTYEVVTEAVQEPAAPDGGFALEDISGQVYTRGPGAVIVAFYADKTGAEFNSGEESSTGTYAENFSWDIVNGFLELDYTGEENDVSVELTGVSGTAHSVIVTESDGEVVGTINRIKSLLPADLNNKVLALSNPDDNASCEQRTISFSTENDVLIANMRERCEDEFFESTGFIVSADSSLDNVVKLSIAGSNGSASIVLVDGDLSTVASVKLGIVFDKGAEEPEAVMIDTYLLTEDELTPPLSGTSFSISNVARQVYVDEIKKSVTMFGGDNGAGVQYELDGGDSDAPMENAFSWSVVEGSLAVDFSNVAVDDYTAVLDSVDGNVYQAKLTSYAAQPVIELLKAKMLSIASVNGKIISLDMSQASACSAMSFAFSQDSINLVEVCTDIDGGVKTKSYALNEATDVDNVLILSNEASADDTIETSIILIDGLIGDTGTSGKVAFVVKKNGVIHDVAIHDFAVVDEEVSLSDATGGTLASLIVGKTLYQHVSDNGQSSASTYEFKTNGELVISEFGQVDTIPYRIDGDIIYTTENDNDDPVSGTPVIETSQEQAHSMIENTTSYVKFSDDDGGTTTLYYTAVAALAGPVDDESGDDEAPTVITSTTTTDGVTTVTTTNIADGTSSVVTTTTNADGTSTVVTTTYNADGSITTTNPDGSTVTTIPDDGAPIVGSTSSVTTTNADGTTTMVSTTINADGTSTVVTTTFNADGSITTINPDGSTTTTVIPDNSGATNGVNGTTTTTNVDGSSIVVVTTTNADGSGTVVTTTTNTDGSGTVVTTTINTDGSATSTTTAI